MGIEGQGETGGNRHEPKIKQQNIQKNMKKHHRLLSVGQELEAIL